MTLLVLALVATALWVWSLVDAVLIPGERWAAAGENQVLWVILIVLLSLLGSLLYVLIPRRKLGGPAGESVA